MNWGGGGGVVLNCFTGLYVVVLTVNRMKITKLSTYIMRQKHSTFSCLVFISHLRGTYCNTSSTRYRMRIFFGAC